MTTSRTIKQAMLCDLSSHDYEFLQVIKEIRKKRVELAQVSTDNYTSILLQGSGTYGLEAVISSTIHTQGKLLVIINGAYGKRIVTIASI